MKKKKMKMSKMKRVALNVSIITGLVVGLVACDNELNNIGSEILGADQLNDRIKSQEFDVVAFNELLGPVQTNNFNSMPLGSYTDPIYGRMDYSFVTQLNLPTSNPNFGTNPVLDSVVLNVPYFSTLTTIDGDSRTYDLDSIYGDGTFKLQVYRNNYFLSNFNSVDIEEPAVYFSDLGPTIDAQKGELLYENIGFIPDPLEVELKETEEGITTISQRLTPRLRVVLGKTLNASPNQIAQLAFWQNTILDQEGTSNLQSNSDFQNYFRGLYFKVDDVIFGGNLTHLNINEASVDLYITSQIEIIGDNTTIFESQQSVFNLDFGGNRVGFIDNSQLNPTLVSDIQAANDDVNGEELLYLKGGPGSIVLLDLFGEDADMNGEADALTEIIANDWLINEASLTFYVDQNSFPIGTGASEPERITVYDFDNNVVLADFLLSTNDIALNSNVSHLGRLERVDQEDESSEGVKYKIRLTQHINNIINGDTENVRLAVAVTQNVNLISNSDVKGPILVEEILLGSAISHEGTVLHGNLSSNPADDDKRLRLKIFYTESN